ncbi:hypothetical protein AB205_0101650, partial [Aquarana catesbeiana]
QLARVEEAVFPPQQRSVHLGDSTTDISSQHPDEGMEKEAAGSPPQWQLHTRAEDVESPAEVLARGQSAAGLCPQLTEEGVPVVVDGTSVSTDTTPENGATLRQEDVSHALQALGDFHLLKVDGTSVPTCIPQGCWSVGPNPQQHDGVSPVTLSSLQRLKGLQGEGPVQACPQWRACSLREAEVGS